MTPSHVYYHYTIARFFYYIANMLKSPMFGPLAQLVERVIRIDEVSGSIPLWSTIPNLKKD